MCIKQYIKTLSAERWNIGFINTSLDDILYKKDIHIEWMKHNIQESWFADPFLLDVTDSCFIVLAEEFTKRLNKGRISKLIIDRHTYKLEKVEVVKELSTHMSFPVIIREPWFLEREKVDKEEKGNFVYIMPENGESGKLKIYKYNFSINKLEDAFIVLEEDVADAVPIKIGKDVYMFCTKKPMANGNVLYVYKWDKGVCKFILIGSKVFNENVARMAGCFFVHNRKMYRPTQECNIQYGHAITLQEITCNGKSLCETSELDIESLEFKEVRRIYSTNPKLPIGMHTFNTYKGIIVTDALGFDNMWIRKILHTFHIK